MGAMEAESASTSRKRGSTRRSMAAVIDVDMEEKLASPKGKRKTIASAAFEGVEEKVHQSPKKMTRRDQKRSLASRPPRHSCLRRTRCPLLMMCLLHPSQRLNHRQGASNPLVKLRKQSQHTSHAGKQSQPLVQSMLCPVCQKTNSRNRARRG